MKNLLRGSLLTLIFVGMSSFTVNSDINMDEPKCEDDANLAYGLIELLAPNIPQDTLNDIWLDAYWTCINRGGDSDFTANP
jgi:hypothetical protein